VGAGYRGAVRALPSLVVLAVVLATAPVHAQEIPPHREHYGVTFGTAASYLAPTRSSRQVQTAILDLLFGVEVFDFFGIDLYAGLSVAGASGWITQWDDHFVDVRYDTRAGALGPVFVFRVEPFRPLCVANGGCAGFSFAVDAGGALLFYSSHFPPGGDIYDFAWRVGGTLGYQVTPRFRVELGGRWMHVSNGQGLGPFNPAYEGAGVTIGTQITL
jgi:hypothetical protein